MKEIAASNLQPPGNPGGIHSASRRVIRIFGALDILFSLALFVLAVWEAFSRFSHVGGFVLPILLAGIYFFWLGYRAYVSPSPMVVKQVCNTQFLVVAVPFVAMMDYFGWSRESAGVMLMSSVLVVGGFWLSAFGGRYFCRRLFERNSGAPANRVRIPLAKSHRMLLYVLFWLFELLLVSAAGLLGFVADRHGAWMFEDAAGLTFLFAFIGLFIVSFILRNSCRRLAVVGWLTLFVGFLGMALLPV